MKFFYRKNSLIVWLSAIVFVAVWLSPKKAMAAHISLASGEIVKKVHLRPRPVFSDQRQIRISIKSLFLRDVDGFSVVTAVPGRCFIGSQLVEQQAVSVSFSGGRASLSAFEAKQGFDLEMQLQNDRALFGELICDGFDLLLLGDTKTQ